MPVLNSLIRTSTVPHKNVKLMSILTHQNTYSKNDGTKLNKLRVNVQKVTTSNVPCKSYSVSVQTGHGQSSWNTNFLLHPEKVNNFMGTLSLVLNDVKERKVHPSISEINEHYTELTHYTLLHKDKIRPYLFIAAYESLEKSNLGHEKIKSANLMGWILETYQGYAETYKDLVDNAKVRRDAPCWYRRETVGLNALSDVFIMEQVHYFLLKKHFGNEKYYSSVAKLFHDTSMKFSSGFALDLLSTENGKPRLEVFTTDRFNYIADNTVCYHTFQVPLLVATHMADSSKEQSHVEIADICKEIGRLYKIQNDFIDCFGSTITNEPRGTSIENGRCTWLAVTALQQANKSQQEVLKEFYGNSKPGAREAIMNLFKEMNLKESYNDYLKEFQSNIFKRIDGMSSPQAVQDILSKISESLCVRVF